MTKRPFRILPIIVLSQFACTSLWFAGNAVLGDLQQLWGLGDAALTIVYCIGFFITIISIQFTNYLINFMSPKYIFLFLVPGPILGLVSLWPLLRTFSKENLKF